jgi:hypothetical protein
MSMPSPLSSTSFSSGPSTTVSSPSSPNSVTLVVAGAGIDAGKPPRPDR